MRVVLLELRRTKAWYGAVIIVGISLWSGIVSLRTGVPLAGDATAGVTTASVYATPLVAACFAVSSSSRRVRGLYVRAAGAARAGYAEYLPQLTALITVLLLGCGVTVVLLQLTLASVGAWGVLIGSWLVVWAAALVLAGTVGYLIGLIPVPRVLAAPLAFGAVFGAWSIVSFLHASDVLGYGATSLFPVMTNTTNPFVRYLDATPTGQVLFFLGLAMFAFAVTATYISMRRRGLVLAVVGALVACTAGGALVIANDGQVTTGNNAGLYTCVETTFTVCVHPAYANGTDQLVEEFGTLAPRVTGTPLEFTRLEQNVAGVGERVSAGAKSVYVEDLGEGFADLSIARYIQKYGGSGNCSTYEGSAVESVIDSWLAGTPSWVSQSNALEAPIAQTFEGRPMEHNRDWLISHFDEYVDCSLTFDDLES